MSVILLYNWTAWSKSNPKNLQANFYAITESINDVSWVRSISTPWDFRICRVDRIIAIYTTTILLTPQGCSKQILGSTSLVRYPAGPTPCWSGTPLIRHPVCPTLILLYAFFIWIAHSKYLNRSICRTKEVTPNFVWYVKLAMLLFCIRFCQLLSYKLATTLWLREGWIFEYE